MTDVPPAALVIAKVTMAAVASRLVTTRPPMAPWPKRAGGAATCPPVLGIPCRYTVGGPW